MTTYSIDTDLDLLVNYLQDQLPDLGMECIEDLIDCGIHLEVQRGELVIRQGDSDQSVYLLVSGKMNVVQSENNLGVINTIVAGEIFGEMSALTGKPRTVNIFAKRDSHLMKFKAEDFNSIGQKHPKLHQVMTQLLMERLQQGNTKKQYKDKIKTIAVLAATPGVDIKLFCESLKEALSFHGKTTVLDEKQKNQFGESKYQLLNWLSNTETQSDFVVFEGNQLLDDWTKQSIRQADKVLIIKRNQNELIDRELYNELVSLRDSKKKNEWEIVLSSPSPSVASDQEFERRFWLSESDLPRLARAISGTEIQLILGGGGARGFAHLGVIRAMEELGIPIDNIAGTSIGSVIGALVAKKMKHADIMSLVKKAFLAEKPMKG
ncbi:MAG: cyclic nucleotide-binding domain-containing protein, partial [Flavobacteriales bacterium]|nr:cyclic nucleotide-binding domain-containing protein [Flavobacteriales bacterium]